MDWFPLSDGARLRVCGTGPDRAAVTVVFVHGVGCDHRVWHKMVAMLPAAATDPLRLLTYDLRGHGGSTTASPATATVHRLGTDLAELVAGLVPSGRTILVGHGVGGSAILAMAGQQPAVFADRIDGVVLLATSASWLGDAAAVLPAGAGRLVKDLGAILGDAIPPPMRVRLDRARTVGLRWLLLGDDPADEDVTLLAEMITEHWPEPLTLFHVPLPREDRVAALAAMTGIPVLTAVGESDRLVPATHAELVAGAVPDGTALVLPGAGHLLPLESAAQLVPRILGMVNAATRTDN